MLALEDETLDLKTLHFRLESGRLPFASAEVLWQVLGVRPGSVTPFALINDSDNRVSVVLTAAVIRCYLLRGGECLLGIPTIWNRVMQNTAKLVLKPIFETDFEGGAYSCQPDRSQGSTRLKDGMTTGSGT